MAGLDRRTAAEFSFIVAWLAVVGFLRLVQRVSLNPFAVLDAFIVLH